MRLPRPTARAISAAAWAAALPGAESSACSLTAMWLGFGANPSCTFRSRLDATWTLLPSTASAGTAAPCSAESSSGSNGLRHDDFSGDKPSRKVATRC
jgi:hypothetical protein